jgi:hypothetical protein
VSERLRLVVVGGLGAMPFAGVAWQVLQYLGGFHRLGHEVFYLEDTGAWPYDPGRDTISEDARPTIAYVARLLERIGLGDAWVYRDAVEDRKTHGMSEEHLQEILGSADALVNVSGATVLRHEHLQVPVRIYLETDPGLPQIQVEQGNEFTIDLLAAHTHHFTYGENVGAPDCDVPTGRFRYRHTRPPVVLDWWTPLPGDFASRPFTTVSNWEQTSKDVEWRGRLFRWSKHTEFQRFLDLPKVVDRPLELALALDDADTIAIIEAAGWRVVPAGPLSKDIDRYRDYIRSSAGEFSVAKEQYVSLHTGWFSDRTACYLAAGKPAVVQDTAFGCALPTGEGLFAFEDLDDVVAAFAEIDADYPRHSDAARALAEEYLDSDRVLGRLLEDAGLPAGRPGASVT